MIIYFSATGNSKYVAEQIASNKEQLIFIPDAIDNRVYEFTIEANENVGIISPTYDWTIPSIVEEFLKNVKLIYTTRPYIYYVGTFGTTTGAAATMANHYMKAKGYEFDAFFDIKMPDTWTPVYNLSNTAYVNELNRKADDQIQNLKKQIENKTTGKHMHFTTPFFTGKMGHWIYNHKTRYTRKFHVTNDCIGCCLCAKKCPVHAIEMKDNHPIWVKEKCTMCLGCLHRCPKFAIQYGKSTKKHGQYLHP